MRVSITALVTAAAIALHVPVSSAQAEPASASVLNVVQNDLDAVCRVAQEAFSHQLLHCPQLMVVQHHPGFAAVSLSRVVVSMELLAILKDRAELVHVLGHEIGHIVAGHSAFHPSSPIEREVEADMLGAVISVRLGYRCDAGITLLQRIAQVGNEYQKVSARIRAEALRRFCRNG